jgi:hypothetical protein
MFFVFGKNEAKPRGALHLPGSSVREVDEQTSIKRSKEKKLKFGFELESRHAKRVYFIVTNDEQVRQVSFNLNPVSL